MTHLPLSPDPDSSHEPAREPLPGDFLALQFVQPFVVDDGASKSLHFTHGELQSRLLTSAPWRLDVDYTRTMMGFLLFGRSFDGNAVDVASAEKSNGIVFAGRDAPLLSRRLSVSNSLAGLNKEAWLELKAELARLVWQMGRLPHDQ